MATSEEALQSLERHLGGPIPARIRTVLLHQERGEVLFPGTDQQIDLFGLNRIVPRLSGMAGSWGNLARGVLPVGLIWCCSSEIGVDVPTGRVIDLHGQPDRPRAATEYGEPFRGEWRVIAASIEELLQRIETDGIYWV